MSAETKTLFSGTALGLSGPLRVEILPNGMTARLTQPFRVRTGFETDFASVPRLFWRVVPPWGRYSPAAVVHDYLYHTGKVSRLAADRLFLELMAALGVPLWKRQVMYWAVRLGGWLAWDASRKREAEHA